MVLSSTKQCPFDQCDMVILSAREASEALIDLLVAKQSPVYALINGAKSTMTPRGQFCSCPACGFLAIFIST